MTHRFQSARMYRPCRSETVEPVVRYKFVLRALDEAVGLASPPAPQA